MTNALLHSGAQLFALGEYARARRYLPKADTRLFFFLQNKTSKITL